MSLPPVCILAGGLGTRLGVADRPKPLVEVAGEPFLFHQLRLLASHGADRVVICVGHLGEQIEEAVGDGAAFGLRARCVYDPPGLAGTAGAIRGALEHLGDEFLVLYGDTYLRVDYGGLVTARRESGLPALMAVLHNAGRWDTSNAVFRDGRVVAHDKHHPTPDMEWIDYGVGVLTAEGFAAGGGDSARDLADVYHRLAAAGLLAGALATNRFYEIGSPEALAETDRFLRDI
jgi:NDP-sugar pyrophosphorylase family protein